MKMYAPGFTLLIFWVATLAAQGQHPSVILQEGHFKTISQIAYSADGALLVALSEPNLSPSDDTWVNPIFRKKGTGNTGVDDGPKLPFEDLIKTTKIIIWDVRSEKIITQLTVDPDLTGNPNVSSSGLLVNPIRSGDLIADLEISPGGRYIAAIKQKSVFVWDLERGNKKEVETRIAELDIEKVGQPWVLQFSPDGKYLAVGANELLIFSTQGEPETWSSTPLGEHKRPITTIDFSSDGKRIGTGQKNGTMQLFDLNSRQMLASVDAHKKEIQSLRLNKLGNLAATGGKDNYLRVWSLDRRQNIFEEKLPNDVQSVVFSQDGAQLFARVEKEAEIRVWDVVKGVGLPAFREALSGNAKFSFIEMSPDGKYLAVSGYSFSQESEERTGRSVKMFEIATHRIVRDLKLKEPVIVESLAFNGDATQLVSYSSEGLIKYWDLVRAELISATKAPDGLVSIELTPSLKRATLYFKDRLQFVEFADKDLDSKMPDFSQYKVLLNLPAREYAIGLTLHNRYRRLVACPKRPQPGKTGASIYIWDMEDFKKPPVVLTSDQFDIPDELFFNFENNGLLAVHGHSFYAWNLDGSAPTPVLTYEVKPKENEEVGAFDILIPPNSENFLLNVQMAVFKETESEGGGDLNKMLFKNAKSNRKPDKEYPIALLLNPRTGENTDLSAEFGMAIYKAIKMLMSAEGRAQFSSKDAPIGMESPEFYNVFSGDGCTRLRILVGRDNESYLAVENLIGGEKLTENITLPTVTYFKQEVPAWQIASSYDGRFIATGGYDGSLKLWNAKTNQVIGEVVHRGEDYIFLARRKGAAPYYKMSKGANDLVSFRIDKEVFPFEAFDVEYNRHYEMLKVFTDPVDGIIPPTPEIAALITRDSLVFAKRIEKMGRTNAVSRPEVVQIDNLAELPIEMSTRALTLQLSAHDAREAIVRLVIWINDVPVLGSKGMVVGPAKDIQQSVELTLMPGPNKIQLVAVNERGGESLPKTFYIDCNTPPIKPNLYLVSIGSGKFIQSEYNLTYPAKDASDILRFFNQNSSVYGEVKAFSLLDEKVTRDAVLGLHDKLMQTRPEDRVILFFAGHGSLEKKGGNYQLFLSTYDMDFSNPSPKGVKYEELEGLLDGIPAREKVMLLDGCHTDEVDSKGVAKAKEANIVKGDKKFTREGTETNFATSDALFYEMKELYVDVRRGSGATILAGTRGQGLAQESDAWGNGAYTKVLLEGLKSKADLNGDGKIFCSELQKYLGEEVPKLTGGEQVPATRQENIYNDLLLWQYK